MDVAAVKDHCSRLPGASAKLYGPPSNVLVYYVGGRKFAYFKTSEPERWRFSIRTTPDRFLELTDVQGIKPARYLARFRWVTIVEVGAVPAAYLQELIGWSHAKALSGLSARRQSEILAGRSAPPPARACRASPR
jgi:predicted DNA-binding protein (MmcQ/YjbR family)